MKTLNPFTPTKTKPVIVPSQLTKAGGALYLVNQTNNNHLIDFQNGNTATLTAQHARLYKLRFPLDAFVVSVQSPVLAAPLQNPQIWGEAFQPGEDVSGLYSGPLTNDLQALGQPLVNFLGNVDNSSFGFGGIAGLTLYLVGFVITMDKAATPSSGLMNITGFDTNIVPSTNVAYELVQSNQMAVFQRWYQNPLPTPQGDFLNFSFPNLSSAIYLELTYFYL